MEARSGLHRTIRLRFDGFFPPVKADGSGIYKQGRTLPVKLTLEDVNGVRIADAVALLVLTNISGGISESEELLLSMSAADTGNQFRYDAQAEQYIFNLNTDPLTVGTWELRADLDDGRSYTVTISIRS